MSEYIVGLKYWSYFTAWLPHKINYYRVSAKNEDEAEVKHALWSMNLIPLTIIVK